MIQPWPKIVEHYEQYLAVQPSLRGLATVARFIDESPLAGGLHAWTSMHTLCIVQTEVSYPYQGPMLVVSAAAANQIEFRYADTPDKTKQWHRTVDPDQAVERLLSFLDQLRWFPVDVLESLGYRRVQE
jgi:hypothetical protein